MLSCHLDASRDGGMLHRKKACVRPELNSVKVGGSFEQGDSETNRQHIWVGVACLGCTWCRNQLAPGCVVQPKRLLL